MADFKTHISASTLVGVGYGTAGFLAFGVPPAHCFIAGCLCSVAGMLPDLDSASGKPQREMLSFVSVVVPMFMLHRFQMLGMSPEQMVFASVFLYVVIRFGIGGVFRRYTKHRGMWHSIPAAIIAGLTTFLVSLSTDFEVRLFKSWAVVLGFVVHLVLDEIYAVDWQGRRIRVKKSFGTALKFYSKSTWANISTYGKLILLIALVSSDGYLMDWACEKDIDIEIPQVASDWFNQLFGSAPDPGVETITR